jgi:hypothetical protein
MHSFWSETVFLKRLCASAVLCAASEECLPLSGGDLHVAHGNEPNGDDHLVSCSSLTRNKHIPADLLSLVYAAEPGSLFLPRHTPR